MGVNKTICTSEKAEICIFYNSRTIVVIRQRKMNLCFFPLFLLESEENERALRSRNRQFILHVLSGLTTHELEASTFLMFYWFYDYEILVQS